MIVLSKLQVFTFNSKVHLPNQMSIKTANSMMVGVFATYNETCRLYIYSLVKNARNLTDVCISEDLKSLSSNICQRVGCIEQFVYMYKWGFNFYLLASLFKWTKAGYFYIFRGDNIK